MRVAAIVLNFRLPEATALLLDDLLHGSAGDLGVILVENGSGDDSAARLRQRFGADARVELVESADNLGYCAGVNVGLRRARERGAVYALLVNNDARVPPDLVPRLVAVLDADPALAGVSPTIVEPSGRTWCQGGRRRFGPNGVVLQNQGRPPAPTTAGPEQVDFLTGACALYRLVDLAAVGDLDETYFMYVEDVDLGLRLAAAGRRLAWIPWLRVEHAASSASGGGRSPLRKFFSAVNTVRLLRRHGRARDWLAFALFDVLLWPLTLVTGPAASLAKARGLVAGLFGRRLTAADVDRYLPPPRRAAQSRS